MPTYEFTCPDGHDFDKFFRSMASAPTVVPCPVCGKPAERQMSAGAGLVFHGSGFYITDYGKDGKKDQRQSSTGRHGSEQRGAASSSHESTEGSSGGNPDAAASAASATPSSTSDSGSAAPPASAATTAQPATPRTAPATTPAKASE